MADFTIAIGFDRNDGKGTLTLAQQRLFVDRIKDGVQRCGGEVVAVIAGFSEGGDWGSEPGAWLAGNFDDSGLRDIYYLRGWLAGCAKEFHQDAIALTVGNVEFVNAE